MKTLKIKTTGKSVMELLGEYGTCSSGFYGQDWYKNEKFYTEKPEAGEFEIVVDRVHTNKTFEEQKATLKEGEMFLHPAQYIEAMLVHYKETGERLFEDWYIRTNIIDTVGCRVSVGDFDAEGLSVNDWVDGNRYDRFGVSAARKLSLDTQKFETAESLSLAIEEVKKAGYKVIKEL